jgi:hypothetical protein
VIKMILITSILIQVIILALVIGIIIYKTN